MLSFLCGKENHKDAKEDTRIIKALAELVEDRNTEETDLADERR